jgi:hypothetical protein
MMNLHLCRWRNERFYLSAAVQEPAALMRRPVNHVVLRVLICIQQAVVQEGGKVKAHLLGAEVGTRHDVRLFNPAVCGDQNVIDNIQLAPVFEILFQFSAFSIGVVYQDYGGVFCILASDLICIKFANFMIFALQLTFMVILNTDRLII